MKGRAAKTAGNRSPYPQTQLPLFPKRTSPAWADSPSPNRLSPQPESSPIITLGCGRSPRWVQSVARHILTIRRRSDVDPTSAPDIGQRPQLPDESQNSIAVLPKKQEQRAVPITLRTTPIPPLEPISHKTIQTFIYPLDLFLKICILLIRTHTRTTQPAVSNQARPKASTGKSPSRNHPGSSMGFFHATLKPEMPPQDPTFNDSTNQEAPARRPPPNHPRYWQNTGPVDQQPISGDQ